MDERKGDKPLIAQLPEPLIRIIVDINGSLTVHLSHPGSSSLANLKAVDEAISEIRGIILHRYAGTL